MRRSLKTINKMVSFSTEMSQRVQTMTTRLRQLLFLDPANNAGAIDSEVTHIIESMIDFMPTVFKNRHMIAQSQVDHLLDTILIMPDLTNNDHKLTDISQRGKVYKKFLKMFVNENGICSKDTLTKFAYKACGPFLKLTHYYNREKNHDLAHYYANLALECSLYIEPSRRLLKEMPILVSIKDVALATSNFTSHLALRSKGHTTNYSFLKKCLQHTSFVYNELFLEYDNALKTLFSENKHSEFLELYSKLPKQQATSPSQIHLTSNAFIITLQQNHGDKVIASRQALAEEYKAFFEQKDLPGLTLSFENDELRITRDESAPFKTKDLKPLIDSLTSKGLNISQNEQFLVISNVTSHPQSTWNKHLKTLCKYLTQQSVKSKHTKEIAEISEPEIADIAPVGYDVYSTSCASTSSTSSSSSSSSTRIKVKTRVAVAAPAIESDSSEEEIITLTKRTLGFKMDDSEVDEPVYALKGPSIIPGVYFAYKNLGTIRTPHLDAQQIQRHEQIIREGNVVAPGKQGLRLTRVENAIAFKTTIPNHDARVIMTVEQEHTTDDGRKIFLYRPTSVRLHNQNKRNGNW